MATDFVIIVVVLLVFVIIFVGLYSPKRPWRLVTVLTGRRPASDVAQARADVATSIADFTHGDEFF